MWGLRCLQFTACLLPGAAGTGSSWDVFSPCGVFAGHSCPLQAQRQQCRRRARAKALRVFLGSYATPTVSQNKPQAILDF